MSIFFSKLLALLTPMCKNTEFVLCFVHLIAEVRLRFGLVQKSRSAIVQLHCALTELKSRLRKLRCASENKKLKLRILPCAFIAIEKAVAFCCTAILVKYSCPPLPTYLYHTRWMLHIKQEAVNTNFQGRWFDPMGIEPESTVLVAHLSQFNVNNQPYLILRKAMIKARTATPKSTAKMVMTIMVDCWFCCR